MQTDVVGAVIDYLVHNQPRMKELIAPYWATWSYLVCTEPPEFYDEITQQYFAVVRSVMACDIVLALHVDLVQVKMILEETDLKFYLEL